MRNGMGALKILRRAHLGAYAAGGGGKYIEFADPAVEAVLIANGVSSDGVGITLADAEAVASISTWFKGNTEITSFDEFEKFTGIVNLGPSNYNSQYAFQGCTSLESIRLPQSVQMIGVNSFSACTSLTSINLPESITTIKDYAFYNTPISGAIYLPNLSGITQGAFCRTNITRIDSFGSITALPNGGYNAGITGEYIGVFCECEELISVDESIKFTSLGRGSFAGCSKLAQIDLSLVETIGTSAFRGCLSLSLTNNTLSLPSLKSLDSNAFYGVPIERIDDLGQITTLITPYNSRTLGDPNYLTHVVLPPTIEDLGTYALSYYKKLATLVCYATTPPTLQAALPSSLTSIYVPDASVDAYKAATNWATYAGQIKAVSELPNDNPTLYDEIKDYLK